MKKSKAKSKSGRGGARPGAGRPRRWKHRPLKMIQVPVVFAGKILEIAQYMDQNDGRVPCTEAYEASIVISGHPSESLSGEEIKELSAKRKAQKLAQKVMAGDEWVLAAMKPSQAFDIFFCSPPIFSQRRGVALSRGESKIRDELSFQASNKPKS